MEKVYECARKCFDSGEDFVMVTILERTGSAPRDAGAKMLVCADGTTAGTIGGGSVEYKAQQVALEVMKSGEKLVRSFDLGLSEASELGMVCGGRVTLEFCPVNGKDVQARKATEEEYRRYRKGIPTVYIFGGGHVSQATVPVLASVGFRCVVADDRAEFADPKLFPQAEQVCQIDFRRIDENIQIRPQDYVVVMTRGHAYDYEVQAHALARKPAYIGIMGSRHKIAFVTKRLLADGFSREEIEACHMPIGLPIKAETPEEIAVSIAAELILIRAEKNGTKKP